MSKSSLFLSALCLSCLGIPSAASAGSENAPAQDACKLVNAPSEHFEVHIPFDVVDGRIYVQVRVNNRGPFRSPSTLALVDWPAPIRGCSLRWT